MNETIRENACTTRQKNAFHIPTLVLTNRFKGSERIDRSLSAKQLPLWLRL